MAVRLLQPHADLCKEPRESIVSMWRREDCVGVSNIVFAVVIHPLEQTNQNLTYQTENGAYLQSQHMGD